MPDTRHLPKWVSENLPPELAESTLFRFEVTLPNETILAVDMLPDLDVDYDALENQLEHIPAQYAYWAAVYSELKYKAAILERKVKATRGVAIEKVTANAASKGVKLNGDQVKIIAEGIPELQEMEYKFARSQMLVGKIFHMVEAVKLKAEVLRSLAGFKRIEHQQS